MPRVIGAVLAAGSGSRMGAPKALVELDGVRLVDRAVAALAGGGCPSVVVVGRVGLDVPGARVVVNVDPDRGMRSSLELAVEAAPDADAIAVLLVDTPGITASAVRAVVDAWTPGRIATASYRGRRSHPTVMAPQLWRAALALSGSDEGARALLASRPELIDEVAAEGDPSDLDTPAELAAWRARRA